MAHTYNSSTLGGRGGRIPWGQKFETCLGNIVRLCLYLKKEKEMNNFSLQARIPNNEGERIWFPELPNYNIQMSPFQYHTHKKKKINKTDKYENMVHSWKQSEINHLWKISDIVFTEKNLWSNCLKYIHLGKGNDKQRTKRKPENQCRNKIIPKNIKNWAI